MVREEVKRTEYEDLGHHTLIPFVFESYGAWGPAAVKFFDGLVRKRHNRLGGEVADATWATKTLATYWRQRLSVKLYSALGRGLASRAHRDWGR